MKKGKQVLIYLLAILFVIAGILKLAAMDAMSKTLFAKANYPMWLYTIVAIIEIVGGIFIIINKTRTVGCIMLGVVMIGAIVTHIYLQDNIGHLIAPILLLALLTWLAKEKWV